MCYIPDAYDQFVRHEAEQQAQLDKLPKCYECGEAIQDEHCYEINGEYICNHCMEENHRVHTEDIL